MGDPYKRDRRLGRLRVDLTVLDDWSELASAIQHELELVVIDYDYARDQRIYTGTHPTFDIVEQGVEIPVYTLTMLVDGRSIARLEYTRQAMPGDPDLIITSRAAVDGLRESARMRAGSGWMHSGRNYSQ